MGMFDTVTCKYPIEGEDVPFEFQTKQFDCAMENYTITEQGRLVYHKEYRSFHPDPSDTFLGGHLGLDRVEDIDTEFHGDIELEDFTLRFTDGTLTRVIHATGAEGQG